MFNLFYRNHQLLILTILFILIWGLTSFFSLPRMEDPPSIHRFARIYTHLPGASPERIESLITEKIEDNLLELEDIDTVWSTSSEATSVILVQLKDTIQDVEPVWSLVRSKVEDTIPNLPPEATKPEYEQTPTQANALIVGLTWEWDQEPDYALLWRLAEKLQGQLRAIPGSNEVTLFGNLQEEIQVAITPSELSRLRLTPQALADQIAASDAKVSAGQYRSQDTEMLLEVNTQLTSLENIRAIPIQVGTSGQIARLGDVAEVSRGIAEPPSHLTLINGRPAVAVSARVDLSMRVDQWFVEAQQVLNNFEADLFDGIGIHIVLDQSKYVEQRLNGVMQNLIFAALLVTGVSWIILGWKSAVLVGLALPLASLTVFGCMTLLGISLHQVSVTGIIIALGLLIDNAIIAVDEVQARLEEGFPTDLAVSSTVRYLSSPLLASTLTTVLAFVPIAASPGSVGEFIGSIGLTVIIALLSSLFLSLTIIPALAGRLHQWHPFSNSQSSGDPGLTLRPLVRLYQFSLQRVFVRPWLGIGLGLILPVMGWAVFPSLEQQFFPPTNRDQFQIEFEFPTLTPIRLTQTRVEEARRIILQNPKVEDVHWFLGESAPRFFYNVDQEQQNAPNYAQGIVQLHSTDNLQATIENLQQTLDVAFPEAQVLVRQLEQGPQFSAPIELVIYGSELAQLREIGKQLRQELVQVEGVTHTHADLAEALPKLALEVDKDQAQRLGLENRAIANQLDATLEGIIGSSILEGREDIPVRVRVSETQRGNLAAIKSLEMLSPQGQVPLNTIATLTLKPEITHINHKNGQRINTVQGFIRADALPNTVLERLKKHLARNDFQLPPGYRLDYAGEVEVRGDAIRNLLSTVSIILILMTATLVLSFNSFSLAALIASVALLSTGLAFLSLKVFDSLFGFTAILGTLGLIGLAINDSIVVLAALRDNHDVNQGNPKTASEVVLKATRHILATTLTTIAGFIPLMLDPTGFWPPLAIVIAGGLGWATVLALYYVPSAYLLLQRGRGN